MPIYDLPTFRVQIGEMPRWGPDPRKPIEDQGFLLEHHGNLDITIYKAGLGFNLTARTNYTVVGYKDQGFFSYDIIKSSVVARESFDCRKIPENKVGDFNIAMLTAEQPPNEETKTIVFWSLIRLSRQLRIGMKKYFPQWWEWWSTNEDFIDDEASKERKAARARHIRRAAKRNKKQQLTEKK